MSPQVALAGLLAVLAVGVACNMLAPVAFTKVMCALVVTGVVWPRLFELAVPPRFALAVLLALGAISLASRSGAAAATRTTVAVMILGFTGIVLVTFLGFGAFAPAVSDAYFRYVALVPLSAVFGYLLVRTGPALQFGHALLAVALVSSILAVVERVTDGPILPGNPFDVFSDGHYRAAVFSEQALVLASFLVCALAVALVATRGVVRVVVIVTLLGGIEATVSRGALFLAVGYLGVAALYAAFPATRRYSGAFKGVVLAVFFAVPLIFLGRPSVFAGVTSSDPAVASLQYRGALYSLTFDSLLRRPLGWGVSGPPAGEYTFRSPFGVLDVTTTVDSEFVLTVLQFGVPGLVALAAIAIAVVRRLRADRWWTHVAVLVTLAGLYLSIHAWLGLLSLWAIAIGATLANPPEPEPPVSRDSRAQPATVAAQAPIRT